LSINQTNVAVWSALLAGAIVPGDITQTNLLPGNGGLAAVISPVGPYNLYTAATNNPPLWQIINGINNMRTNYYNGEFQRLGDILSVPQLTVASPYLSGNAGYMSDAIYERIPQMTLGMLKCDHTPRFVIFAYGQSLKPANNSIVTGGNYSGLCTNYQITAESASRAVVRMDKNASGNGYHAVIENFNYLPPD
jgi:hypothetical protein